MNKKEKNITNRMRYLIDTLNKAAKVYYQTGEELMPNFEYDKLERELEALEQETGIMLSDSPTIRTGISVDDAERLTDSRLAKVTHEYPARSLAKTKDESLFPKVFSVRDNMAVLMWKEDGGTIVATYDDGKLVSLATRGNGLVVAANDVEYAESQPGTGHNPNRLEGFALKWQDETVETTLRAIEWSPSRTGLLNPVAVFDPVELEGTTVSRASVHNVSIIRKLQLRIGDTILVYKANKIIPQIAENVSAAGALSDNEAFPKECPCCHGKIKPIITKGAAMDVEVATCANPDCPAKHIGKYTHFVERDCMNIMGLSKATITYFIDNGWISEFSDIYHLGRHKDEIIATKGYGKKSYENMIKAIEKSRKTSFVPFIHAVGIPNIGEGQAKLFAKEYNNDIDKFLNDVYAKHDFSHIDGIGPILNDNLIRWGETYLACKDPSAENPNPEIRNLLTELSFENQSQEEASSDAASLSGLTFVITGDVHHFKNRNELKAKIESLGGKVSGSVSSKTSYLINNDSASASSKNKKAKELGVKIISEEEFLSLLA